MYALQTTKKPLINFIQMIWKIQGIVKTCDQASGKPSIVKHEYFIVLPTTFVVAIWYALTNNYCVYIIVGLEIKRFIKLPLHSL